MLTHSWGGPPGLSGWACGPRIVMKARLEGGQSCPQPAFSRLLAALQFSITYGGFSTVRGPSRTRCSRNGISDIPVRTGRRGRRPQDWSPAPRKHCERSRLLLRRRRLPPALMNHQLSHRSAHVRKELHLRLRDLRLSRDLRHEPPAFNRHGHLNARPQLVGPCILRQDLRRNLNLLPRSRSLRLIADPRRLLIVPTLVNHQVRHRSARVREELHLRIHYLQEELSLRLGK